MEGECFDAAVLLSLFVKRSLSLLSGALVPEKAAMFLFTVDEVNKQTIEVLSRVAAPHFPAAGSCFLPEQGRVSSIIISTSRRNFGVTR